MTIPTNFPTNFMPSFYDPKKCGTLFKPDLFRAALEGQEFAKKYNIPSSEAPGQPKTVLTIIDNQVDFTNPTIGNLFVPGAVEDIDRLSRFIIANLGNINHILCSLDTHYLFQPFSPMNWMAGTNATIHTAGPKKGKRYEKGEHPDQFTIISLEMVNKEVWLPTRKPNRARAMLEKLEAGKKKQLCIWPWHCILGTPGHALDPSLMEIIYFHAAARNNQYNFTEKGMSQSAEHYGILMAEAQFDDDSTTQLNASIVNEWQNADTVWFAGQAKSHCVLETLSQIVNIFTKSSPELLKRLRVLKDCMSSVPDIQDENGKIIVPFNAIAENEFKSMANAGVQFVNSTDIVRV